MRKLARLIPKLGRKLVTRPREALLLCQMAWWVAVVSVTARWYSLPRALAIVAGHQNGKQPGQLNQEELARAIDLPLSADVLMFKPICWKRAAVLHRYLLRNGVNTRIIFGVRNDDSGQVTGHAWLESEGRPILETTPPEYITTYTFPSSDPIKKGEATSPLPFVGPT